VGYMLRANLGDLKFSDFQELPPWRSLVPRVAREIVDLTGQDLIAVQTVLDERFWAELRAGLASEDLDVFHVVLDADEDILQRRIAGDEGMRARIASGEVDPRAELWRSQHVPAYLEARSWMLAAADLVIDTSRRPPGEIAQHVLAASDGNRAPGRRRSPPTERRAHNTFGEADGLS